MKKDIKNKWVKKIIGKRSTKKNKNEWAQKILQNL